MIHQLKRKGCSGGIVIARYEEFPMNTAVSHPILKRLRVDCRHRLHALASRKNFNPARCPASKEKNPRPTKKAIRSTDPAMPGNWKPAKPATWTFIGSGFPASRKTDIPVLETKEQISIAAERCFRFLFGDKL
jgi:hypothetical protein